MATVSLLEEHNARRCIISGMLTDIADAERLLNDADIRREVSYMFMLNACDYLALLGAPPAATPSAAPSAAPLDDATTAAAAPQSPLDCAAAAAAAAPLDASMTVAIEAAMTAATEAASEGATDEFGLPAEAATEKPKTYNKWKTIARQLRP